ncbi:hypothetical protein KEM09_19075 [Carboxylicivirga mesophila]|uniref:Tetratricopeptide repeat protein n=1 Tax=Carboxylicivirga mesophila TaxID=1166478 RepID=A0ABS5KEW2_9BACT|nr:hypothetical protein [Carboxylicivirga mesophila]MBS2213521.1 hypothetical protein [Carboxylicivirga mesophila]
MDYDKKILQLFTNELDPLHRAELKAELVNNEGLKEDVKLQQEVLYTIANHEEDYSDFRKQLKDIGNEFITEEDSKKSSFKINYWLAAASVVVVIGLGSYLGLLRDANYTGNQAFVEYYSPYGADLTVRGGEQSGSFNMAFELYHSGDMNNAIEAFNELREENEELAGFFTGLCYLELGEIKEAKNELEATRNIAIFYEEQVKWYLALCHLKLEEYKDAELLLTQIMTSNNKYAKEAKDILAKLDS